MFHPEDREPTGDPAESFLAFVRSLKDPALVAQAEALRAAARIARRRAVAVEPRGLDGPLRAFLDALDGLRHPEGGFRGTRRRQAVVAAAEALWRDARALLEYPALPGPRPGADPAEAIPAGATLLAGLDDLDRRGVLALEAAGIADLNDVTFFTAAELKALPRVGHLTVKRLRAALARRGLHLAGEDNSKGPGDA